MFSLQGLTTSLSGSVSGAVVMDIQKLWSQQHSLRREACHEELETFDALNIAI